MFTAGPRRARRRPWPHLVAHAGLEVLRRKVPAAPQKLSSISSSIRVRARASAWDSHPGLSSHTFPPSRAAPAVPPSALAQSMAARMSRSSVPHVPLGQRFRRLRRAVRVNLRRLSPRRRLGRHGPTWAAWPEWSWSKGRHRPGTRAKPRRAPVPGSTHIDEPEVQELLDLAHLSVHHPKVLSAAAGRHQSRRRRRRGVGLSAAAAASPSPATSAAASAASPRPR